jgi:uncharacterized protein YjbI with pentapeptide repeats
MVLGWHFALSWYNQHFDYTLFKCLTAYLKSTLVNETTKLNDKWRLVWEIVKQGGPHRDLIGMDLSHANLQGTNLNRAKLVGTQLQYANLSKVSLMDASLIGANLTNAKLLGANLLGANLSDADLGGAEVEKAQFGYNLGISSAMKWDLIRRGAIFQDAPGDRASILTPV